jgi:serine/threonine protein kinase
MLGQVLGNYRIARLVGAGGMGRVYLGVNPQIGSRVAIKVLSEECAKDRSLVERFFTEARAVNVIRHESIVNVVDINQLPDGRPYIVMELLEGDSLAELIRRGPIPLGTLSGLMTQVLDGLAQAHEKGIIHRDLKPDNIFVTRSGRAKILDFGIAKLQPELGAVNEGTRTGALIGTPFYMPPEQALARPVDARSDLYSLGIILYEAVTGRRPFQGSTIYELLKQHVEVDPPPPTSLRYDLTPALESVIRRAMAKNPSQRFQSAQEFAQALEAARHGLSTAPVPSAAAPTAASPYAPTPHSPSFSHAPSHHHAHTPHYAPAPSPSPTQPSHLGAPPPAIAHGMPPGYAPVSASFSPVPAPQASRSNLPIIAAAGCGLLLVAGIVVGAALMIYSRSGDDSSASVTPTSTPRSDPTVIVPRPDPTVPVAADDRDFNPKSFDVSGFLGTAEKIAHRHLPDSKLVGMDITGVSPKGILNFELSSSSMALYRFRSPARSTPPADFPKNASFESNCVVYVMVQKTGVTSFVVDRMACDIPFTGTPTCSIAKLWQRAEKQGAPLDNVIGNVGFNGQMMEGNKLRWYMSVAPSFSAVVADGCE